MHPAIKIAKQFVDLGNKNGQKDMTVLKLMKLAYIAHGYFLVFSGRELFGEEIKAWKYGPVIPEVYIALEAYKDKPITEISDVNDVPLSEDEVSIVEQVFKNYGDWTASQLIEITKKKFTPWHEVTEGGKKYGNDVIIQSKDIWDYYRKLIIE